MAKQLLFSRRLNHWKDVIDRFWVFLLMELGHKAVMVFFLWLPPSILLVHANVLLCMTHTAYYLRDGWLFHCLRRHILQWKEECRREIQITFSFAWTHSLSYNEWHRWCECNCDCDISIAVIVEKSNAMWQFWHAHKFHLALRKVWPSWSGPPAIEPLFFCAEWHGEVSLETFRHLFFCFCLNSMPTINV